MPRAARLAVVSGGIALMSGACGLWAEFGTVILHDLTAGSARLICL